MVCVNKDAIDLVCGGFRPDSFGLWYYKVSKMWSVIILGPKIFGLWWSAVVCGVQADPTGALITRLLRPAYLKFIHIIRTVG